MVAVASWIADSCWLGFAILAASESILECLGPLPYK